MYEKNAQVVKTLFLPIPTRPPDTGVLLSCLGEKSGYITVTSVCLFRD